MPDEKNETIVAEIATTVPVAEADARSSYHLATREYYYLIGVIASGWSHLEQGIDDALWRLAGVHEDFGACLTAQFLSISNRIMALEALLRLRGVSGSFIEESVSPFAKRCSALAKRRNRAIHDPIAFDPAVTAVLVHRIIAERKLHKGARPAEIAWYVSVGDDVFSALQDWFTLEDRIIELLPSQSQT